MRTLFYFTGLLLIFSCKNDPVPILPLPLEGFDDKIALVVPSGVLTIKMNQPVIWRSTSGTITHGLNDTLIYKDRSLTETQSNCTFVSKLAGDDAVVFALNATKPISSAGTIPVKG